MNRRDFVRRSAILAAGVVAADQLELVERLGWTRRLFPSCDVSPGVAACGLFLATKRSVVIAKGGQRVALYEGDVPPLLIERVVYGEGFVYDGKLLSSRFVKA